LKLIAAGELPNLAALHRKSARFLLDHGAATRTGLAWEHVSSGRSPADCGRWSGVTFDTSTYRAWFDGTSLVPFPAALKARTVIFDAPYFDLRLAPTVRGITNWGAHDPGVICNARPLELIDEIHSRFGKNPAHDTMYDIAWESPERVRKMADTLVRAVEVRTRAARWLLEERCSDWDFGLVVAGEAHSASEAFWYGIDPAHALYALPSAEVAREGLHAVYRATDSLVGELLSNYSGDRVVAFAMNGMGPNRSDVASMALLSELLHRNAFGRGLLRVPRKWRNAPHGIPMLDRDAHWSQAVKTRIAQFTEPLDSARLAAALVLPEIVKRALRPKSPVPDSASDARLRLSLDWMPSDLYQRYWRRMRFFALPSFYDGRVRINLAGRESQGMVSLARYEATCAEIESLVTACRDLQTGEPVVDHIERCARGNPLELGPTESDLIIVWSRAALGFQHPLHGEIGPLPFRRTGGHTGPYGMAYLSGDGISPCDYGVRSSFDVVPSIVELLGEQLPLGYSGTSLLPGCS